MPNPSRSLHPSLLTRLIALCIATALIATPLIASAKSDGKRHHRLKVAHRLTLRSSSLSSRLDSDKDGLSNWTESHVTRTNPYRFDTDGDGFGDGAEVAAGSDPRNPANVPTNPPPPPPDTTPPDTSILSGPSGTTTSTSASFGFSASESGSSFQCSLDSGPWSTCTSPKAYSALAVGTHTFSVRATDAAGNTDASPATYGWTVQSEGTGGGTCTQALASGASLSNAVASAPAGAVICLGSGSYSLSLSQVSKSSTVTVQPAAGAAPTLGYSILNRTSGIRLKGLKFTGGLELIGATRNIEILGNEFTGEFGIRASGEEAGSGTRVSDVLIEGNNLHDLDYTGSGGTAGGYGITAVNGIANFTIRGNTIKSVAQDYVQAASPAGFVVEGNTFLGPSLRFSHPTVHQDLLQVFGGGSGVVFAKNVARNTQTNESLMIQDGVFNGVRVEGNLFDHDSDGYTCQIYQVQGLVFRQNTVVGSHWGCLFRDKASNPAGSGYEVDHNIFASTGEGADVSIEGRAGGWGVYDYNVSKDGSAGGSHSVRSWSPSWVDTIDYMPQGLSLVAGYRAP